MACNKWPTSPENMLLLQAKNKGADQTAHVRSLIRTPVIRLIKSRITKFAISKFSTFLLVSVTEQAG